jgi:hypothetical protein
VNRIESAYNSGVEAARNDIASGNLRLHYGARGAWGDDLAETLRSRFGVELIVVSCLMTDASWSYEAGYNATIESHIDRVWGSGSIAAIHAEVQQRRKAAYDAWVKANNPILLDPEK